MTKIVQYSTAFLIASESIKQIQQTYKRMGLLSQVRIFFF